MKTKLTPAFVTEVTASPGAERTMYWDQSLPGFGLMVTTKGAKSYVVQYRAGRRSRRMTIDGVLDLSKARKRAKALLGEVAHDRDPQAEKRAEKRKAEEAASNTLKSVAEDYLKRGKGLRGKSLNLRSLKLRKSTFERNIFPRLGADPIDDIRRSDITKLLDRIEDECGPTPADQALAFLSRVFSWHASRSDDSVPPSFVGWLAQVRQSEPDNENWIMMNWWPSGRRQRPRLAGMGRWCGSCCLQVPGGMRPARCPTARL